MTFIKIGYISISHKTNISPQNNFRNNYDNFAKKIWLELFKLDDIQNIFFVFVVNAKMRISPDLYVCMV